MIFDMISVKINNDVLYARPFEWIDNLPSKYMLTCSECAQLLVLDDDDLFMEKDYYIFKLTEEKFKIHNNKCPLKKNSKYVASKNDKPTLKEILEENTKSEVEDDDIVDNETLHILSEINTVKKMILETPIDEVIDRGSLQNRLHSLEEERDEQFKNNYKFKLDIDEDLQKIFDENVEIVYGNQ